MRDKRSEKIHAKNLRRLAKRKVIRAARVGARHHHWSSFGRKKTTLRADHQKSCRGVLSA